MSTTPQVYFNPWDPEFRADPYPYYAPLLAGPPPVIELVQKIALIARYADVTAVLRDARFSADRSKTTLAQVEQMRDRGPFKGTPTILTSDPPVHTRLRRLVSRDFTPRRIREIEPRIREITAQLQIGSYARLFATIFPSTSCALVTSMLALRSSIAIPTRASS